MQFALTLNHGIMILVQDFHDTFFFIEFQPYATFHFHHIDQQIGRPDATIYTSVPKNSSFRIS